MEMGDAKTDRPQMVVTSAKENIQRKVEVRERSGTCPVCRRWTSYRTIWGGLLGPSFCSFRCSLIGSVRLNITLAFVFGFIVIFGTVLAILFLPPPQALDILLKFPPLMILVGILGFVGLYGLYLERK